MKSIFHLAALFAALIIVSPTLTADDAVSSQPGANALVSPEYVQRHAELIQAADAILIQFEIPIESVVRGIEIARAAGVRVIVDPAPVPAESLPDSVFEVDLICPNETEAALLVAAPVETPEQIESAARVLARRGAQAVAITRGDQGVMLMHSDRLEQLDSLAIEPVDSTAAGDAFAGAVAVRWCESGSLVEAIRFGNVAGALATTRRGAQPSLATRDEILKRLQ